MPCGSSVTATGESAITHHEIVLSPYNFWRVAHDSSSTHPLFRGKPSQDTLDPTVTVPKSLNLTALSIALNDQPRPFFQAGPSQSIRMLDQIYPEHAHLRQQLLISAPA